MAIQIYDPTTVDELVYVSAASDRIAALDGGSPSSEIE